MVNALREQKIFKRKSGISNFNFPGKNSDPSNKRKPVLTYLVIAAVLILISSSVVFILAMADSKNRNQSENISTQEIPGGVESSLPIESPGTVSNPVNGESLAQLVGIDNKKAPDYIPAIHILEKGDSISKIAKKYKITIQDLIIKNKIVDASKLRVNEKIEIPQTGLTMQPVSFSASPVKLPEKLEISADPLTGTVPLKVNFYIKTKDADDRLVYLWDFNNDKYAFDKETSMTFSKPGKYLVSLMVSDTQNNRMFSNKITIEGKAAASGSAKTIKTNLDTTVNSHFIVLNQLEDVLDFNQLNSLNSKNNYQFDMKNSVITQTPELLKQIGDNKFSGIKAGFSKIRISNHEQSFEASVFISPMPVKNVNEPDFDWYRTQFDTGMAGNCGPACVAIGVAWAKLEPVTVKQMREEIGMPFSTGAVNFINMMIPFQNHKVNAFMTTVGVVDDLYKIIDRGNVCIILFHTGYITEIVKNKNKTNIGRYYEDTTGHYIVLKGYTLDRKYFVVYDPIPGDWVTNSIRYEDGDTMLGKNRYYLASEIWSSLRDFNVLEISQG